MVYSKTENALVGKKSVIRVSGSKNFGLRNQNHIQKPRPVHPFDARHLDVRGR
jgi:hypothetical protein